MTVADAYHAIVAENLYEFHADSPINIVRSQIRRHCEGLDFPSSSPTKHFKLATGNRYQVLEQTIHYPRKRQRKKVVESQAPATINPLSIRLKELQKSYGLYIAELKNKLLCDLKGLSPATFEAFARRMLDVYGFHETKVTPLSGDGGIDGYGKLKVGLAHLNVAFQCKRWTRGKVQRPEVDRFRGAIQGEFEQGVFFTTAAFSEGAIAVSVRKGAAPIVLVDGEAIVNLMIEKNFGVQIDSLAIPSYALDLALDLQLPG